MCVTLRVCKPFQRILSSPGGVTFTYFPIMIDTLKTFSSKQVSFFVYDCFYTSGATTSFFAHKHIIQPAYHTNDRHEIRACVCVCVCV
jgi:hypothetical protein